MKENFTALHQQDKNDKMKEDKIEHSRNEKQYIFDRINTLLLMLPCQFIILSAIIRMVARSEIMNVYNDSDTKFATDITYIYPLACNTTQV